MPNINELIKKKENKDFTKKSFRAWDLSGDNNSPIPSIENGPSSPFPSSSLQEKKDNNNAQGVILEIDPSCIKNWEFSDRPATELGDIHSLAEEFKAIGQLQPCIVRNTDLPDKYELIVGERRWKAAQLANIKLKVVVKNISDSDAAIMQAAENDNRVNLSDYAKGISFSKLIESGVLKQIDLVERLGRTKQYISALLSFSKIPAEIINAIGDMTKVSAKTGEQIKQLSLKGPEYISILISLSERIRDGKIGGYNLAKKVTSAATKKKDKSTEKESIKQFTSDGRHVLTWRKDNNNNPSIHFPNNIVKLLSDGNINMEAITKSVIQTIEAELLRLKQQKSDIS